MADEPKVFAGEESETETETETETEGEAEIDAEEDAASGAGEGEDGGGISDGEEDSVKEAAENVEKSQPQGIQSSDSGSKSPVGPKGAVDAGEGSDSEDDQEDDDKDLPMAQSSPGDETMVRDSTSKSPTPSSQQTQAREMGVREQLLRRANTGMKKHVVSWMNTTVGSAESALQDTALSLRTAQNTTQVVVDRVRSLNEEAAKLNSSLDTCLNFYKDGLGAVL
eukprot:m.55776 g.55776  ORF g.55776 m.55776 type:complete len:224 (+) comp11519_c0_seq1:136-807(+)